MSHIHLQSFHIHFPAKDGRYMRKAVHNDLELLELIKSDADRGLKALIDQYSGFVYHIVRERLKGKEQDIEECVADVFTEFFYGIDKVDTDRGSIKAYLATMAARRSVDRFRKLSGHEEIEEIEETVTDTSEGPEQIAIKSEESRRMLEEIKSLGEPDSVILYRRYFLSQPVKDIADCMGMKSNSVTKRIQRALKVLKVRLEGEYER